LPIPAISPWGDERAQLERWSRRATSSQALALRSRIVLACAVPGAENKAVAAGAGCTAATAGKWRARFIERRLDGLVDEDRPGRPSSVSLDQVEDVIVATLESKPGNATHWSQSSMARKSGLSRSTIGRIWKDFGLQPHRADGFKVSADPLHGEGRRCRRALPQNAGLTPQPTDRRRSAGTCRNARDTTQKVRRDVAAAQHCGEGATGRQEHLG
jgi:transposase